MALYRYKAVSPGGDTLQGQMEALSVEDVIAKLQEAGNVPISAQEATGGLDAALGTLLTRGARVSQREVAVFTQQLSTLIGAGLPLDRALHILHDLADSEAIGELVKAIRDEVRGGASLSDALEARHGVFNRLYINMVRAGEAGGTLDVTLARLAEYLERSKELKDSVISALIYPVLLLFMAIGSLVVLLIYVVPQFMPIFEELGAELPLLTQIVLGVGRIFQQYWWLLLGLAFAVVLYFRSQFADPKTRYKWDRRLLRFGLTGDLIAKVEMARLSRTVGTLLTNGVPLLAALSIGRNVVTNTVMAEGVETASKEVKTGGSLAHNLARAGDFPKLALQMINVGEETGQLDVMLVKVADTYDREVRTTIDRLMAAMVPILTLTLAVVIALIVMSILVAILSVNELVA
ncbi:MAG: type II secretion system F family protein [Xanthomonadales bacterium]|nr:type II secretion system F family protein [Xanthomonadales bacterium]